LNGDVFIVVMVNFKNVKEWVKKVDEDKESSCKSVGFLHCIVCLEGATGMVVKVEQHVLIIISDTTKEHVSFIDRLLNFPNETNATI